MVPSVAQGYSTEVVGRSFVRQRPSAFLRWQGFPLRNLELKALYEMREEQEQFLPRQLLPQTTPATCKNKGAYQCRRAGLPC